MPDSSDRPPRFSRLRERKLVQWAVAYLAGAWLLLEVTSFAADNFGWPQSLNRILLIVFTFGLVATLVLAWYHGEQGRQRVSGSELLILTLLLAGGGATLAAFGPGAVVVEDTPGTGASDLLRAPVDTRPGLAVLPFESRAPIETDRWFTDGLHDEFLTRLQGIAGLRVIDSESVQSYGGESGDVGQIGDDLGVAYLLRGAVQKAGDQVSARFRLIDVGTREQLWTADYQAVATPDSLMDIQVAVAQALTSELQVAVSAEETRRLAAGSTNSAAAYALHLQALAPVPELPSFRARQLRSIRLLEEAVREDPEFVDAYAHLARLNASLYWYEGDRTPERARLARQALETVQRLDPGSDRARLAAGWVYYWVERDYDGASEEVRGIRNELAQGRSIYQLRASIERRRGNLENSLRYGLQAASLNPRSGSMGDLSATLRMMDRYDEAELLLRQQLERFPDSPGMQRRLAEVLLYRDLDFRAAREAFPGPRGHLDVRMEFVERDWAALRRTLGDSTTLYQTALVAEPKALWRGWLAQAEGDPAGARPHFEQAIRELEASMSRFEDDDRRHRALGLAFAALGREEEAIRHGEEALALLSREADAVGGTLNVMGLALIHAQLGNVDEALLYLEDYLRNPHFRTSRWHDLDPRFDPIRDDPRFDAIIQRYWPADAER